MIQILFISILVALTGATSSNPTPMQWARTRDKEGSTNVRATPDLKGKILTRILVGELFKSEVRPHGEWFKVETKSKIAGYVHKDRVLLIHDTAKKDTELTTGQALGDIFKRERELLKKFASEKSHSTELTQQLDTYTDTQFEPALLMFSDYICKNRDSLLVDDLFDTVLADPVGTTEAPANAFAKALLCQSDLILHSVRKLPKERKDTIIDKLILGLQNYYDIPEDQDEEQLPKEYLRLKARLDELREKKSY